MESSEKLKEIPTEFSTNGYFYTLITRKGNLAMYSQKRTREESGGLAVEVHKIRKGKVMGFLENSPSYKGYTHYEKLASDEEFGRYAWSFPNIEVAHANFPILTGNICPKCYKPLE